MAKITFQEEWHQKEFQAQESGTLHDPMAMEYLFYEAVRAGNIAYVMADNERGGFSNLAGKGTLSRNPLHNIKYHFVVTTALVTRNCTMAGMVQEQAYCLSDFYIQKMDECMSVEEVIALHHRMVLDYTNRMLEIHKEHGSSAAVSKSIEYIYSHLHGRLTIEEIADYVNLSPSHLSRIFKKEIGIPVSDYIRSKKIDRAKNLLRYSDFSFVEISNYLSFASQSHFVSSFKHYVGITPKKYRDSNYRTSWLTTEASESQADLPGQTITNTQLPPADF